MLRSVGVGIAAFFEPLRRVAGQDLVALGAFAVLCWSVPGASEATSFTPGHYFTTISRAIVEHDQTGAVVGTMNLEDEVIGQLRGLDFGPSGLLYVSAVRDRGFEVLAVDAAGSVHERYQGDAYYQGNGNYGKIAVDDRYVYAGGQTVLTRFERGVEGPGTVIHDDRFAIFDVELLPNGNLLVLSTYAIHEMTTDGELLRSLGPFAPVPLVDARGFAYDALRDTIFATHLGTSSFHFRLMALSGETGALLDSVEFRDPADVFLTREGLLLVGSRFDPTRIYSRDLELLGEFESAASSFVTQFIPEPSTALLVGMGLLALGLRSCEGRRRV